MSPATRIHSPSRGPVKGYRPLCGALLIERSRIRPDPNQVRRHVDAEAQKELNDSVKRHGILQPITVRLVKPENVFQIVAGHRRFAAACAAGLIEVPCWVQSPREEEVLLHQIVENWQRLDMHPYDLADALVRLRDGKGYSQRDLARETGKSECEISKFLALLELAPEVQQIAREDETGRITRRHLYAVRNLPPEEQLQVICRAQQEGMRATDVEKLVAKRAESPTAHKPRDASASRRRFETTHAIVTLAFDKTDVTSDDILAAFEEARRQVSQPAPETPSSEPAT
jgi:ParB family chromosome partitioning protein